MRTGDRRKVSFSSLITISRESAEGWGICQVKFRPPVLCVFFPPDSVSMRFLVCCDSEVGCERVESVEYLTRAIPADLT